MSNEINQIHHEKYGVVELCVGAENLKSVCLHISYRIIAAALDRFMLRLDGIMGILKRRSGLILSTMSLWIPMLSEPRSIVSPG